MSVDSDSSPVKGKGKAKAPAPPAVATEDAGPSGPPAASAVTGVVLASVDQAAYKSAALSIAQNLASTNDGLARHVTRTRADVRELTSDVANVRAQLGAIAQDVAGIQQGDPAAVMALVESNNDTVEVVSELRAEVSKLTAWREEMLAFVLSANARFSDIQTLYLQTLAHQPAQTAPSAAPPSAPVAALPAAYPAAPGPPPAPPATRPLKRLRASETEPVPVQAPAPVATSSYAVPQAPPPLPPPSTSAMATAPPPTPAAAPSAPSPSVLVGPLKWQKDITGQMRTLISIMPNGATVTRNVRASRAGPNYVHAIFPSVNDAYHFVAMWNMARPAGYESVEPSLN
ncbi:hypothetical protein EXIGLDRAFT_775701 [Exidia glandulosa HHB12029]|uniref:Uncharacterized protein n=1 Tax=Exidia glandulosa HHB12029 TaxID=1314781 RepID=A0A165DSQ4_EXIGL|nr:hypothetical protein EXIGLDRAFT_775701 [Exidia glandulosa HHB12029]